MWCKPTMRANLGFIMKTLKLCTGLFLILSLGACDPYNFEKRREDCKKLGGILVLSTEPPGAYKEACINRSVLLGEM